MNNLILSDFFFEDVESLLGWGILSGLPVWDGQTSRCPQMPGAEAHILEYCSQRVK